MVQEHTHPLNAYSGVSLYATAGSQYIQYRAECYSGVYPYIQRRVLLILQTVQTCEAHERSRSSILYITLDISSLVVYATLYMLSAVLYVLGTYAFVSLLLYSMNKEPPPERVDKGLNTVVSSKGHTNDNAHKSNTQSISRAHKEHHKVN